LKKRPELPWDQVVREFAADDPEKDGDEHDASSRGGK